MINPLKIFQSNADRLANIEAGIGQVIAELKEVNLRLIELNQRDQKPQSIDVESSESGKYPRKRGKGGKFV